MSGLTWLHLSDWHQKGKDFDRRVIRDALIKDIDKRTAISPDLARIDFIVFSGDVAYSGKPEEYQAAKIELFDPILKAAGLNPDRLFIVPGNHDLDRGKLDLVLKGLLNLLKPYDQVKDWLNKEEYKVNVLEPFQAFTDFVTSYTHQENPEYANIREWDIDGRKIALLGINSAWACGRKDYDRNFVFVGEPQIYDPLEQISSAEIKIAVLHHPFDWLDEDDLNHVEGRLMKGCDFILQGHQHKPNVAAINSTSGSCVIIPAGACYNRRIAIDPRYTNAYNFLHLDLDSGKGIVFLRRWNENQSEWREDVDLYRNGQFEFTLPKRGFHSLDSHPYKQCVPMQKPPRPQHFIGRDKELDDLLRNLQPGRIITLCGPGGIGKTALASEVIWQIAPNNNTPCKFPDGIIFHTFYHQPQAALALEAIAYAFGEEPRPNPVEAARRVLASRHVLLVLDGAESADDLDSILSVAGSCGVLITTRPRSVAPANWMDIHPLTQDQAVKLLKAWGGSFAADDVVSGRICELLGNLPLAVYLVGRFLSQHNQFAAEYLAWLKDTPLAALNMGERQHQSISVLMERSVEKLDNQARSVLSITGLLALQSFESNLIAKALEIPWQEVNRCLGELVNYGMLIRSNTCYQITHALIHTYAREKLVPPTDVLIHLARCYLNFIDQQVKLGRKGYIKLDDHRAHIISVQSACIRIGAWGLVRNLAWKIDGYLKVQGHWIERTTMAKAGLSAARADKNCCEEGAFLNLLGVAYKNLGNIREAIHLYKEALVIYRDIGNCKGEARVLDNLGIAYKNLGETRRAIELYEEALRIYCDIKNSKGEAKVLDNMGIAYKNLGKTHNAIKLYEKALAIYRDTKTLEGEARVLDNLGIAYKNLGNTKKACRFCKQALEIAREIGDRRIEGNALGNLGLALSNFGDDQKAIELCRKALTIARNIGDRRGEGYALSNVGLAYVNLGEYIVAIGLFKQCLTIAQEIGDRREEEYALGNLGLTYYDLGEKEKAIDFCQDALVIAREIGDRRWEGIILSKLGLYTDKINDSQKALNILKEIGDCRQEGYALCNLGLAYTDDNDIQKAIQFYEHALSIFQEIGDRRGEAKTLWNQALCYEKISELGKAIIKTEQAVEILKQLGDSNIPTICNLLSEWKDKHSAV